MEHIVGIDLGTTNSEITCIMDGKVMVVTHHDDGIMPSCVGLDDSGNLIVGREAKNQAAVFPERTVSSIKRLMGTDAHVSLGGKEYTPQEISALILKTLKQRAEAFSRKPVRKAVITVPAYFTDSQRKATREAGSIAGLDVVRIINEPTAAALAYEHEDHSGQTILVFDLGGGTFDVSIVRIENSVVEVLASTGDNHLGGDDFDKKLADLFAKKIEEESSVDVKQDRVAMARLVNESEKAKIELTSRPFAQVEIDHIAEKNGASVHFSYALARDVFEELITDDIDKTMNSVNRALEDAAILPSAINRIILVGGSTRMPMISRMLHEKFNLEPHGEIDPDLCVSIGAGIQAGREMGVATSSVLIDITPYTFGTSAFGVLNGMPSPDMYVPIIRRNSKLPVSKTEVFYTMVDFQDGVDLKVYQGENPDAGENLLIGDYHFKLSGKQPCHSTVTLRYDLDINGILKIESIESNSGKKLEVTIENAFEESSAEAVGNSKTKIEALWQDEEEEDLQTGGSSEVPKHILDLINLASFKLDSAPSDDRDTIVNLIEDIRLSVKENDLDRVEELTRELDDILFYID